MTIFDTPSTPSTVPMERAWEPNFEGCFIRQTSQTSTCNMVEREKRHHKFVRTQFLNDDDRCIQVIGIEHGLIRELDNLEEVAIAISRNNEAATNADLRGIGKSKICLSKIGRAFWRCCQQYDQSVIDSYMHHEFSPRITIMLSTLKKYSDAVRLFISTNGRPSLSAPGAVDLLNRIFNELRSELRSKQTVKKIKNCRRMERQNYSSCLNYMDGLFEKRSRLLILRIDLYFRPVTKDWGYSLEAQNQHTKLLRALREDRIVDDVMGYISKRENGIDRGMHFHMLVAIDGHKHRDAANLARIIGEYWVKICGLDDTTGMPIASYFNCYTRKDFYEFNCIGLVHVNDQTMRKGLRMAIRYMCKETCQIKAGPVALTTSLGELTSYKSLGKRNIRKGILQSAATKRGAPRKPSKQK